MSQPDYGLDAPKLVRRLTIRGALLVGFAIVLYIANRNTSPGAAAALAIICGLIGLGFIAVALVMIWSSRVGKLTLRDEILDGLPWRGDEQVLDVGCGRGLMLIGAAKRLKSGKAVGVDAWNAEDLSKNSREAALANAKAEDVAARVKIESADARQLPFQNASFDLIVSTLAIHNIPSRPEREKALREIARVLKPGGRLVIFDIFHTRDYAKTFQQLGLTNVTVSGVRFYWCVPGWTITAVKA